jgi:hypothetical protein
MSLDVAYIIAQAFALGASVGFGYWLGWMRTSRQVEYERKVRRFYEQQWTKKD